MLNKLLATLGVALLLAVSPTAVLAAENWEISKWDSQIEILEDGTLDITETIVADFTTEAHHGIFRNIPIKYKTEYGNILKLRNSVESITNEVGDEWWHETSYEGDDMILKIGIPSRKWSEPVTYVLNYTIVGAINYDVEAGGIHDELYWNVTGDESVVPIKNVTTTVTAPGVENANCFTGALGSTATDCEVTTTNKSATITSSKTFMPGEGLSIGVAVPSGLLVRPSTLELALWFLIFNIFYLTPLVVFVFLFRKWKKQGKDPRGRGTIIPFYKVPTKLTPSEAGTIIDESTSSKDITVGIIDLAIRGYIEINEKKKDGLFKKDEITLIRLKDYENDETLKDFEKKLLEGLFNAHPDAVKLKDLKNNFYAHIPSIKEKINNGLITQKIFTVNPGKVRAKYFIIGIVFIIASLAISGVAIPFLGVLGVQFIFAGVTSGIMTMIFGYFMPQKTVRGVEEMEKILGFKEFIKTAETDRLKFIQENDIGSDLTGQLKMFEYLLPYAIMLGVGEKWAGMFKDIYAEVGQNPAWY